MRSISTRQHKQFFGNTASGLHLHWSLHPHDPHKHKQRKQVRSHFRALSLTHLRWTHFLKMESRATWFLTKEAFRVASSPGLAWAIWESTGLLWILRSPFINHMGCALSSQKRGRSSWFCAAHPWGSLSCLLPKSHKLWTSQKRKCQHEQQEDLLVQVQIISIGSSYKSTSVKGTEGRDTRWAKLLPLNEKDSLS